jgi:hypothetical protein
VVETVGVEVKNGADSSGFVDFYEDSSNGSSYFRLYGPEALAGNIFMQLPPTAGATGGSLYFSAANKLAVAAAGTENQLWIMGATIPGWAAVPTWNQNTTGTAANLSGTPALPDGTTATTQSAADKSTKLASTAYVDTPTTQTITTADSGADSDAAPQTITPTANVSRLSIIYTCSDDDECTITMAETGAVAGALVTITNIGTYDANFADQSGVLKLTTSPQTLKTNESMTIEYKNNLWMQVSEGKTAIRDVTIGGFTASRPVHSDGSGNLTVSTGLKSMVWDASGFNVDGTQIVAPASAQLNSGPFMYSVIPTDNDAATIYGNVVMPDDWDAGTITLEITVYDANADPSGNLQADVSCMCRSSSDAINSTWGDEIALDVDLSGAGTVQYDIVQATSAAVTCNTSCAAGDMLVWRYQVDAGGTDATVANLRILQMKMEYGVTGAGD